MTRATPLTRLTRAVALTISSILSVLVLVLAWANLFPASSNIVTLVAASVWGWVGPQLVVVSVVGAALSAPWILRGRTRLAVLSASIAVVAVVSSVTIVGSITVAANIAGGSVNPISALMITAEVPEPDHDEVFDVAGDTELHALVFEPTETTNAPVLLYVHGGGWVGGTAEEGVAMANEYAQRGWLAVSVDYRTAAAGHPAWEEAPADVGCALSWVARYASERGADSEKLTLMGDSAGGNLALDLGWSAALAEAPTSCPELGEVPVPKAVIASYPVANPQDASENGKTWFFDQRPDEFTRDYLGGTIAEFPDRLAAISPVTYVATTAPPTLIVQPERDDFIPAAGNYEFYRAAQDAGADVTLIQIPFTHHAFDILPGSLGFQAKHTAAQAWLEEHGLAPVRAG